MSETAKERTRRRLERGHIYWYLAFGPATGRRGGSEVWAPLSAREKGDAFDDARWSEGNYYTDLDDARAEAQRLNDEAQRLNDEEKRKRERDGVSPVERPRKVESEKDVERYLVNRAVALGWVPLKYSSGFTTGYPDRCILLPGGRTAWVEVKTTGEKPRRLQAIRIRQLREMGYLVRVVDSRRCVDVLIEELKLRQEGHGVPTA